MPLPTPSEGENRQSFVSRCVSNKTVKSDFKKQSQRLAVCYSQWRKSKGRDEVINLVPTTTTSSSGFLFEDAGNGTIDSDNFIMQTNQAGDVAIMYKGRKAIIELNSLVIRAVETIEEQMALEALQDEEKKEDGKDE